MSRETGFSLLELLAVVSIFLILAAVSLVTWQSFAPGMLLNSAAEGLADSIDIARTRALVEHNQWFVILNYSSILYQSTDGGAYHFPSNSYVVVDDDGWLGNGTRQYNIETKFGGINQEFAEEWEPGVGNFAVQRRNNNMMERFELSKGPIKLGKSISFMSPPDNSPQVRRVVFNYKDPFMFWQSSNSPSNMPIMPEHRIKDIARIYIHNQHYRHGDNSKDNLAHRRLIKVYDKSVKIVR
ncbi:type II secretion system protein [bacterium]|nr:type II secretion system protein [candidate division CSSED10-310 bacterium]